MAGPDMPARGLNLRIDTTKIEEALAAQPRVIVSAVGANQIETTLLEITRTAQVDPNVAADNQVNVLC
ncbi:hypothetical protein AB0C12_41665 [Actinoplanes sp. NPDC048967]|uniref:hypothetical protein n=1 Tax=Actinoplanes sp. NPDC048967 TaxID=3155269 RepID=UPI00340CA7AA